MEKKILILFLIGAILISGVFFLFNKDFSKKESFFSQKTIDMSQIKNKKAVMIISFRDFRDAEYFVPKEILEKSGVEIKTASNKKGMALGADGGEVKIDLLVSEIDPTQFDAIIFVGGPGCLEALDNEGSYRLAREVVSQSKILASICISPLILAKAGVLKGKKATVWTDFTKSQAKILEKEGAVFEEKDLVIDGKIITANGPSAAEKFGYKILEALTK